MLSSDLNSEARDFCICLHGYMHKPESNVHLGLWFWFYVFHFDSVHK